MTPKLLQTLFVIFFCSLFKVTDAQEITSKDLYGKWDGKMGERAMTYNFIDDSIVNLDIHGQKTERCYYKFINYNGDQLLGIQMSGPDSTRIIYKFKKETATELDLQIFQVSEYDLKHKDWRGQDAPRVVILKFRKRISGK